MFLPEIGIIISNEGFNLCAGFLYKTDSATCWAENYILNKDAPKEISKGCIDLLIQRLIIEGREQGFKLMMSSVNHPSLIKKLLKAGCVKKFDSNMSNLAMVL
jgi:hypothetical protein